MTSLHRSDEPGKLAVVRVVGDIDMASTDALIRFLDADQVAFDARVILDLRDVAFMDSSGIGALVQLSNRFGSGRLAVVVGPGLVDQVLAITAMSKLFYITDSLDDARRLLL